jgi:serine/threonine protein kinase
MTRLLGDDFVIEIIRSFYTIPKDVAHDLAGHVDQKAEWICWQTGLALKYFGDIIFRVKEVVSNVANKPIDYNQSNAHFTFNFEGSWTDICLQKSSVLEIYIPNHALKIDKKSQGPRSIIPNPDYVAKLLALTVDHIDTLLEDWYPSLGTRFVHTSQGKFLVTRLVPCNACITRFSVETQPVRSPSTTIEFRFLSPEGDKKEILVCEERRHGSHGSSNSNNSNDIGYESATSSRLPSRDQSDLAGDRRQRTVFCFLVEECILKGSEEKRMKCPNHGDVSLKIIAPDTVFVDLGNHYLIRSENVRRGKMLGRGAFGFVFRATVKSKHGEVSTTSEVAMKMLQPVDPGHGAKKSDNVAYRVAHNKWQRDPMQYACKAYCTARQELTILLSLRHPHIVPLIGVCTKPLALILQLAHLGALDTIIREYRRSGARIDPLVVQRVLLQVSRALEYLHQQHIIYRDLKSENVLVWKMYRPHEVIRTECIDVEVKLADYGISRSTLPTGTKGFGGTEGFMAPEIMRFNGEEEYTEKVDCFSFGMFIYELVALRLPFEGQESVKDHILDGGRPPLTPRDTLFPSNILDLMVLCWADQPKERPTASQIVSMISAPEFVHQLDTLRLKSSKAVINSCVLVAKHSTLKSGSHEDKIWETWLSRLGKQTDVLVSNKFNWIEYKSMKALDAFTITSMTVVTDEIWAGDSNATIHTFDNDSLYEESARFKLDPSNETPTAVKSMEFSFELDGVLILTTNGRLWLCNRCTHSLFEIDCECASVMSFGIVDTAFPGFCELWIGLSEGNMSVIRVNGLTHEISKRESICHYSCDEKTSVMERLDVFNVVASSKFVWTYLYPGCLVYQWDINTRNIVHRLDISKLAPCSESIMSISIEEHLSPNNCQVTSMSVLQGELFVGTTWGCLIVVEAETLRPITVFRPHEEEIKCILVLEDSTLNRRRSSVIEDQVAAAEQVGKESKERNNSSDTHSSGHNTQRFIVTVGRGSRSLVSRYVQTKHETVPLPSSNSNKDLFAILWKTGNWQT